MPLLALAAPLSTDTAPPAAEPPLLPPRIDTEPPLAASLDPPANPTEPESLTLEAPLPNVTSPDTPPVVAPLLTSTDPLDPLAPGTDDPSIALPLMAAASLPLPLRTDTKPPSTTPAPPDTDTTPPAVSPAELPPTSRTAPATTAPVDDELRH
ncbi:hypothetical protein PF005_g32975 [Phytophthora fragariae]|uniref:Uncharacterized protein n=1 Tax=Phytophthora fragariae TaxID=53985 RepID=A0A6A3UXF4_9STRA|nr:hypothetical protein PF005_g32975 [Phytophthora fragariae]